MPTSRSIWDLAERATREVERWPEWKKRAADQALVTRLPDEEYTSQWPPDYAVERAGR